MRSIQTIGGYIPLNTPLHKLDARIKIVSLIAMGIGVFTVHEWWALLAYVIGLFFLAAIGGVTPKTIRRGLAPVALIVLVMILFNSVGTGPDVIQLFGKVGISLPDFYRSLFYALRIVVLVVASLILTTTTSVMEITDALTSMMRPLARFGFPVDDVAMTISIALRFIPLIYDEVFQVRDAQLARGANFDRGNIFKRMGAWIPVFIPVFVKLFRRSDSLARAMDARAYGRTSRTVLHYKQLSFGDKIVGLLVLAAVILVGLVG